MRRFAAALVGLLVLAAPGVATASWYYQWQCSGECAPNEIAISGTEGPFANESDCIAARDADTYHRELVLRSGNFGLFEDCYEDATSTSTGDYGGPVLPHQRIEIDGELRALLGVRAPAFDRGVTSGTAMGGQSPDELAASGSVAPAAMIAIQLGIRMSTVESNWTPRGGFYIEGGYHRGSGVSSSGVDLGSLSGYWLLGGIQWGRYLGSSPWWLEGQLGVGGAATTFAPSPDNGELAGMELTNGGFLLQGRLSVARAITRTLRVDLSLAGYTANQRLDDGATDTTIWLELARTGLLACVGITWH